MDVGIVGYGAVGHALHGLLGPLVTGIYDPAEVRYSRGPVNRADIAFVCVPTPQLPSGAADVSIVEEVVGWLEAKIIVIRSTVPVGTCAWLGAVTGKRIVFQPEYGPAETPDHPFNDLHAVRWAILGGHRPDTREVAALYQRVFSSDFRIFQTTSYTAELVKYMENAYLAMKVAFVNELYDIAEAVGVDFIEARELWLADPRIGRSHTWVHPDDRGFGGKCLPKDLEALIALAEEAHAPSTLLRAVRDSNNLVRLFAPALREEAGGEVQVALERELADAAPAHSNGAPEVD